MTLIIAHRGASAYAPENTLAAFALAHSQGAQMIELDVQPTADGRLAVFHDDTTERWDGQPRAVSSCTLAELGRLDIRGERVPALEEALAFAARTGIALNIELKTAGIGARCAALLREFGVVEQVLVSSFVAAALRELRAAAPEVRRAYLMGTDTRRPDVRARELWPFFALRSVEATAWHPYAELPLLDRVIPLVRRAGYQVHVWTVDSPERMRELAAAGASGIITNRPDLARAALGQGAN
ncbi:MAG: glycerophosphodiester phosphodiesterase [Chloroflexales bacterium]|nr:glycerophosphodiester phosphodiesterase [Chloroflexales bacterium]